jgi:DNA-binding NtrC family response regulator
VATILVTDDDTNCRDSIRAVLEREGHSVEGASNVDSALEAIGRQYFDLIVCDYRMPNKTGLDLLAELRLSGSTVPVLMVSAYADAETESAVKALGALGLLKKPFRRQDLVRLTAKAVGH